LILEKVYFPPIIALQSLDFDFQKCYNEYTKGTTAPIQGVGQYEDRKPPSLPPKYTRVGFLFCLQNFIEKRYLQLTKTKVSNAIMNIPKAIRSLKSFS